MSPRHWRVVCAAAKDPFCPWRGGQRAGDTPEEVTRRPCPHCGGEVVVVASRRAQEPSQVA